MQERYAYKADPNEPGRWLVYDAKLLAAGGGLLVVERGLTEAGAKVVAQWFNDLNRGVPYEPPRA
ncbi:hypothetical protein [Azospirillum sp. SYSU D00513]|uniref:hypothetical protein n=1 Tax=Azospirillum sp. SYSU D00513 TaxID=2812561 RepID=UPI001A97725F|nr:hypothetical protein [Azospirillum sp. SYSU D00513]